MELGFSRLVSPMVNAIIPLEPSVPLRRWGLPRRHIHAGACPGASMLLGPESREFGSDEAKPLCGLWIWCIKMILHVRQRGAERGDRANLKHLVMPTSITNHKSMKSRFFLSSSNRGLAWTASQCSVPLYGGNGRPVHRDGRG